MVLENGKLSLGHQQKLDNLNKLAARHPPNELVSEFQVDRSISRIKGNAENLRGKTARDENFAKNENKISS